ATPRSCPRRRAGYASSRWWKRCAARSRSRWICASKRPRSRRWRRTPRTIPISACPRSTGTAPRATCSRSNGSRRPPSPPPPPARARLEAKAFDLKRLARAVIQTFLRQALRDGFFHADMHPGNLFVDDDGELVAVDFGIMGRLGPKERRFLAEILLGFLTRD